MHSCLCFLLTTCCMFQQRGWTPLSDEGEFITYNVQSLRKQGLTSLRIMFCHSFRRGLHRCVDSRKQEQEHSLLSQPLKYTQSSSSTIDVPLSLSCFLWLRWESQHASDIISFICRVIEFGQCRVLVKWCVTLDRSMITLAFVFMMGARHI